jgi:hypothetical protein
MHQIDTAERPVSVRCCARNRVTVTLFFRSTGRDELSMLRFLAAALVRIAALLTQVMPLPHLCFCFFLFLLYSFQWLPAETP